MYIYRGLFTYGTYAKDDEFILVIETTFDLDEPVYAAWQWSNVPPNETDTICSDFQVIDRVSQNLGQKEDSIIGFGFFHGDSYQFDVIASRGQFDNLAVQMTGKDKTTSSFTLTKAYYQPQPNYGLPLATYPRIFTGKMNYGDLVVDKMFAIVFQDLLQDGCDICVYWRWSKAPDSRTNLNEDATTTISNSKWTEKGRSFTFTVEGKYTFDCVLDEGAGSLRISMSPPATGSSKLTLQEQEDTPVVQRRKRELGEYSSKVQNDTGEVVYCSIQRAGSALTDQILAGAGLLLATFGMVAALPGAPASYGAILAVVGLVSSLVGGAQTFNTGGEGVGDLLFPQDIIYRKLSGGLFPDADVRLLVIKIEKKSKLVISTYEKDQVGKTMVSIKDILEHVQPKVNFGFDLVLKQKLVAHRSIVIPFIKPSSSLIPPDPKTWTKDMLKKSMWAVKEGSPSKWYGSLFWSGLNDGDVLFEYDDKAELIFFQGTEPLTPNDDCQVLCIPNHTLVLKLNHCRIDIPGDPSSRFTGKTYQDEGYMLERVNTLGLYWAFTWGAGVNNGRVLAVKKDAGSRLVYSSTPSSVYLVVKKWVPHMAIVPADDSKGPVTLTYGGEKDMTVSPTIDGVSSVKRGETTIPKSDSAYKFSVDNTVVATIINHTEEEKIEVIGGADIQKTTPFIVTIELTE